MPEKSPENYTWMTYAWVFGLSALGGVVSFIRKFKEGHVRAFNFVEFVGELVTSAFAGVITFWLCEWAKIPPLMTAALVGIAGHMGSRAIFLLEKWVEMRFPVPPSDKGGS